MRIESDRRYRAMIIGLLLLLTAAAAYYKLASRQTDPDVFWHIATGRYILGNGAVPHTDVFSWYGIEHGLAWMPQSWLFGVLAYGVWHLGGFPLVYVFTALLAAAAVGLVYRLFAVRSGNRVMALAVAALSIAGLLPAVAPRPHMLTYVLLPGLALLLERQRWWFAVPVVLLAVNLHGPLYPVFLLVVAYYTIPKRWPVFLACTAVTLAQPNGLAMLWYPFGSVFGANVPIQEFARVAPLDLPPYLIALLLLLVLLDRDRIPARETLGMVGLVVLTLLALRHTAFMYLLVLPLVAPYLRLPSERRGTPVADSRQPGRATMLLDFALVGVLLVGAGAAAARAATTPVEPLRDYPVAASDYLREQGVTRYLNEWGDGGFLIFEGMHPLIDGRGDPFFPYPGRRATTMGREYLDVWQLKAECAPFLKGNGITHVLIRKSSALSTALEGSLSFRAVYADETFVIYELLE